jgi:hypothetical protein
LLRTGRSPRQAEVGLGTSSRNGEYFSEEEAFFAQNGASAAKYITKFFRFEGIL